MTRKLLSAVAVMVAVFFTGSIAAQAADVTFGGQLRPRAEWWDLNGGSATAEGNNATFINMRVRLNTKVKIDDNTSAFIQFQSNSRFGSQATHTGSGAAAAPASPNDTTADVGLHQAYFTIKNLFGLPLSIQPGRQEVVLDGHRLFGHTGWTQGAQTHDAIKFVHAHDNMTIAYVFSKVVEESKRGIAGAFAGLSVDDVDDVDAHILWLNVKGLTGAGSSTSAYLVLVDEDCNSIACRISGVANGSADYYTIGGRHAGSMGAISYRAEAYYQLGKSGAVNPMTPTETGDVEAFMLGVRAGYKAANVSMKPSITIWYDYLSGTSGGQTAEGTNGSFNTLFDTGHKFYGYMDFYLGRQAAGLHDAAIKIALHPAAKTTVKLDFHHFAQTTEAAAGAGAKTLGQEIDLTVKYKYSASTAIVAGLSHYLMRETQAGFADNDDASWAYVLFNVAF